LEEKHFKDVSEKILNFNLQKVKEIRELNEKHNSEIAAKGKENGQLEEELNNRQVIPP
jgi:hypothetical protein